jgi:hypothetical protein
VTPVDDELISAYLDGELEPRERQAVEALLQSQQTWRRRWEAFRADSEALRALPLPPLSGQTREVVLRAVTESFALGAERRRVPRYRRRWMLLAAFTVPCLLTLLYLQSPARDSRLYLRGDQLVLRAGRSGEKSSLGERKSWTSPPLWGPLQQRGDSSLSFQLDAGRTRGRQVEATVDYDFDGDGHRDRQERYQPARLDNTPGWQRFTPRRAALDGGLSDFRGGTVTINLMVSGGGKGALEMSGTPGELVLPYSHLRAEP